MLEDLQWKKTGDFEVLGKLESVDVEVPRKKEFQTPGLVES